ncbi:alpha/beta fold hydrolase [Tsukamurella sp. PLM1]|uniref:alpha/beta fold hydrolase n=1 Tax=Tsukamurella sp. PLM1 TaxID=2929795 RepID=UPI0020BE8F99|nr:alpha/beta hydrolase [Tsukamurella sp. PLM1]
MERRADRTAHPRRRTPGVREPRPSDDRASDRTGRAVDGRSGARDGHRPAAAPPERDLGPGAGFAPLVARLPGYRHILVDLPGHGLSRPYSWRGRPVRTQAGDVVTSLLDALYLDRAAFVGNSLGGLFTLWAAIDRPERVSAATIVGAPATAIAGLRGTAAMATMTAPIRGRAVQCAMRLPSPASLARDALTEALGRRAVDAMTDDMIDLHRLPLRLPGQARSYRALLRRLLRGRVPRSENVLTGAELARIACPVLFLWGEQDVFLRAEDARPSVAAIPRARFESVRGGHAPWFDDAAGCAALIDDFLRAPDITARP